MHDLCFLFIYYDLVSANKFPVNADMRTLLSPAWDCQYETYKAGTYSKRESKWMQGVFFFFFLLDFLRRDHFMTSIGTKSGDGVFVNHPNKRWESRILMESANQCAFKNNWTLYFLRFSGRPIEDLFYFFFPTCKQQVDDSCTGGKKNNDFFFLMTCSYQLKFLFLHNPSPWACFSLV